MNPSEQTSVHTLHRLKHANQIAKAAQHILSASQQKAFNQGLSDFENSTRDHPPYGFSDLQQAWQLGWLAAEQKAKGLNAPTIQRHEAALAGSQRKLGLR
jgi:hypothetical protein